MLIHLCDPFILVILLLLYVLTRTLFIFKDNTLFFFFFDPYHLTPHPSLSFGLRTYIRDRRPSVPKLRVYPCSVHENVDVTSPMLTLKTIKVLYFRIFSMYQSLFLGLFKSDSLTCSWFHQTTDGTRDLSLFHKRTLFRFGFQRIDHSHPRFKGNGNTILLGFDSLNLFSIRCIYIYVCAYVSVYKLLTDH